MISKFSFLEKLLLRFNVIPHPLLDALSSVVAGRALQMCVKLGVVDILEQGPISASSAAKRANISEQGALVLLDCLNALGYVEKRENMYHLSRRGQKFLSKDSPAHFRNMLLFTDYLFGTFIQLESTIKAGGPARPNYETFSPETWQIFSHAMIELARSNVSEVAKNIPVPSQAKKLLDIGGSHGLYSIELCRRVPSLSAEIIDYPAVEPFAKSTIDSHGMSGRVRFRPMDFMKDELGNGYDIVLAFNIIHGLRQELNQTLAAKVFQSLNPGGIYVILDQIKGTAGKSPLSRLITSSLGLNLFHQTGGRTYSFEEVREWLSRTGFRHSKLKKLHMPGFALIIGEK